MENKKLLKFLLKDIAEIEELFTEKGNSGFDAFEIDFIRTRFEGAKKIISILEEQHFEVLPDEQPAKSDEFKQPVEITPAVAESVPEPELPEPVVVKNEPQVPKVVEEFVNQVAEKEPEAEIVNEEIVEQAAAIDKPKNEEPYQDEDPKTADAGNKNEPQRLGDRFVKEKSLNDLLSGGGDKLENKLSNTPVSSLQGAININDRYIYIRELFEGNADRFAKAVGELDQLSNIQEAVAYLQQHYKWKKNETSLKFVNLVKRRFPNG